MIVGGKKMRHGHVEIVNACDGTGRFLGSVMTDKKSNEIPAARDLLARIDLRGKTTGRLPEGSHLYLDPVDGLWKPTHFVWSVKDCDRFFARALRFCDIRNDQRRNAYRGVRLFGWIPWRKAKPRGG